MALDRAIEDVCLRIGWDKLYEDAIAKAGYTLSPPNTRGERSCISPFPFSNDGNPSFNVNIYNGLWRDWHTEKAIGMLGGNYVQFIALMNAPIDDTNKPHPNWSKAERELKIELGIANPVDLSWLSHCQSQIEDDEALASWRNRKPWDVNTLKKLGIGWDKQKSRIVIPLHDRDGNVANTRLYKPNLENNTIPKTFWSQSNLQGNFLFPFRAWVEDWVILVEGEPDVISLRSLGYNACCGTLGSGNPVPEGLWWYGKTVYVLFDADDSGEKARKEAIDILSQGAGSVISLKLPSWDAMPKNADISDYILYLRNEGFFDAEIQREITNLIKAGIPTASASSIYDVEPEVVPYSKALSTFNSDKRIKTNAHIIITGNQKYKQPTHIQALCPGTGTSFCKNCIMHNKYRGNAQFKIDPRSRLTLKMIQTEDAKQDRVIRDEFKIPFLCPLVKFNTLQSVDINVLMLTSTLDDDAKQDGDQSKQRIEAYVITRKGYKYESNTDYELTGFVYPMPRSQKLTFLFDTCKRLTTRFDKFTVDDDNIKLLNEFKQTTHDPYEHITDIAEDMASSVTMIHGRTDLHLAYLIMWHSTLMFKLFDGVDKFGLIEMLVVGDTRCGKSATFQSMANWYGIGPASLIDCKMQTVAGLLGAVETSTITGERFVLPGIFPQSDKKVLCLDEFSATKDSRSTMMDNLSSARAERMVRISKAAQGTFLSRVRLAWLSNPGQQKLMRDIGGEGVECIPRLINQPEDIARFDYAMCVSQDDVNFRQLNTDKKPTTPRRSQEAANALLVWAWTRNSNNIQWEDGSQEHVLAIAKVMFSKYDSSIPLVEPADQRNRIAKVAISVATLCMSTDSTYENIIVNKEHVNTAARLFYLWYDNNTMAYDKYSNRIRFENTLADEGEVISVLNNIFKNRRIECANRLIRMEEYNKDMFSLLVGANVESMTIDFALNRLIDNRCIKYVSRGRRNAFTSTQRFIAFLKQYIIDNSDHSTQLGEGKNDANKITEQTTTIN